MTRTALITGAARGIGAATARALALRGWHVALIDVDRDRVVTVARDVPAATAHVADVTDRRQLAAAVDDVMAAHRRIDAVVANAGVFSPGTVADQPATVFERQLEVDLLGLVRTVSVTLPHLERSRGYLLVIASLAAAVHLPLMGAYAASKAGAEALADVLRLELAARGVAVGTAYLSWVDTDMTRSALADPLVRRVQRRLPGRGLLVHRPMPPGEVGSLLADAVGRRARRVVRPRSLAPTLLFGRFVQRGLEACGAKEPWRG